MNLTYILSTDASVEEYKKLGFLPRTVKTLNEYGKYFDVDYFTQDSKDYSEELGVHHHPAWSLAKIPALRHLVYSISLIFQARSFRGVVRVAGASLPVLPILKFISKKKFVVGYYYDWAEQAKLHHGFPKGHIAPFIEKLSIGGADLVLTTSERLEKKIKEKYRKKAITIPNYVDGREFFPTKEKKDYILYVGRLHWLKGLDYLLEAFLSIEKKYDMQLFIAGGGEKKLYERKVQELRLKNVKFLGPVRYEEIPKLMREAKIFVLPTITMEGHPKALLEAMASGTTCIITDVRGSREIVTPSEDGLMVPPKDIGALKDAIESLIKDADLRSKLEKNARKTSEKYSLENTLKKEIDILKELT